MSYTGMNAATGRWISGLDHLVQSIGKILTTMIGSRTMRRRFGSKAPDLIDQPGNQATLLRLYAVAATAIMTWDPRVTVKRVSATADAGSPGAYALTVEGDADIDGQTQPFTATSSLRQ
ncbi:GPW/gp25 family protein [Bordetella sp. H567]|uniref:GPW/gp25 family protein n=1 Tax=Bordetella sp. H567 TaxID=1697043 RepID=UPI00082AC0A6